MAEKYYYGGTYVEIKPHEKDKVLCESGDSMKLIKEISDKFLKHHKDITEEDFEIKTFNETTVIGPFSDRLATAVIKQINKYVATK